jgi:hypothetical protein
MKVRKLGVLAVVGAVAAVPAAAQADSGRDRATGGGQVLIDPNQPQPKGALDTVAFTAQRARGAANDPNSTRATGQVQVNRRNGTEDNPDVKFHGTVTCLVVVGGKSEGEAYIAGRSSGRENRDPDTGEPRPQPFELYVTDGGKGVDERGMDVTMVWYGEEIERNDADQNDPIHTPPETEYCGIEEFPEERPALARGNNQVYDAHPGSPAASSASLGAVTLGAIARR